MTSQVLLNFMIQATMACFPLLMVATIFVFFGRKAGQRFLEKHAKAKKAYDRIVAAGPKEGWSGYIILALVCLWLAVMAGSILLSIDAGDPKNSPSLDRSDMVLVELEDGLWGYVNGVDLNEALELAQSGNANEEVLVRVWSDGGVPIGEYLVSDVSVSGGERPASGEGGVSS